MAAELVSSNYQFGDLRLSFSTPESDGGEPITKYKIEWDASNKSLAPPFAPSSPHYGSAEVTNVREEQEIIVSCRNACSGTFLLSWGGGSPRHHHFGLMLHQRRWNSSYPSWLSPSISIKMDRRPLESLEKPTGLRSSGGLSSKGSDPSQWRPPRQ